MKAPGNRKKLFMGCTFSRSSIDRWLSVLD